MMCDRNTVCCCAEVYQVEGIGQFYPGHANHIKILPPELEQYVTTFVNDNMQE